MSNKKKIKIGLVTTAALLGAKVLYDDVNTNLRFEIVRLGGVGADVLNDALWVKAVVRIINKTRIPVKLNRANVVFKDKPRGNSFGVSDPFNISVRPGQFQELTIKLNLSISALGNGLLSPNSTYELKGTTLGIIPVKYTDKTNLYQSIKNIEGLIGKFVKLNGSELYGSLSSDAQKRIIEIY